MLVEMVLHALSDGSRRTVLDALSLGEDNEEHPMTSHRTGASHGLSGSLRAVDGKAVVRMEDVFDTDVDDLWPALTNPEWLVRWIARVDGGLRAGSSGPASPAAGKALDGWTCAIRPGACW